MFTKKKKNNTFLRIAITIICCLIILITASFAYLIFEKKYHDKIYPNIYFNEINLGGLTQEQAKLLINKKIDRINKDGIVFYYYTDRTNKESIEKITIFPIISSLTGDIAHEIIKFDTQKMIDEAFLAGRYNKKLFPKSLEEVPNYLTNLKNKIDIILNKKQIKLDFYLNEIELTKILKNKFSNFEIAAKNAQLIKERSNGRIHFAVSEEKLGKIINYEIIIKKLKINLAELSNIPIKIIAKTDYPTVYREDGLKEANLANDILSQAPFNIVSTSSKEFNLKTQTWAISRDTLADWLEFKNNHFNKTMIGLNGKAKIFLEENVITKIDIEPIDAKVEIKNNKVNKFQQGKDGLKVDVEASLAKLEQFILQDPELCQINTTENKEIKEEKNNPVQKNLIDCSNKNIELIVKDALAMRIDDVNTMGIKEIIGIGYSNFSGSPQNRLHNIQVGANSLNGLIIKPEEEFSLIKALGDINAKSGYLPELVIKGDKTIPEFGGGLCQIGTTLFRTVVQTGLPVTLRRNHSYRVAYYEPAGTDATIYDPWPDFRFINDTPNHILIQTFMNKKDNTIRFEFWGTLDGRIASSTEPVISNIVEPGPTKIIETTELPIGEKKCTESAHSGADAYFDYTITYPNGDIEKERFESHYIPWQAVCLLGVEEIASSTIEKLEIK